MVTFLGIICGTQISFTMRNAIKDVIHACSVRVGVISANKYLTRSNKMAMKKKMGSSMKKGSMKGSSKGSMKKRGSMMKKSGK